MQIGAVQISSADEMFELGKRIGLFALAGDLILLNGPLGAGKTVLAQGIGAALGMTDVTSPTFVISRIHAGKIPLIHVDAYRLLGSDNILSIFDELDLDSEGDAGVTVIEWGGQESARLSENRLEITIDRSSEIRSVSAVAVGDRWKKFSL